MSPGRHGTDVGGVGMAIMENYADGCRPRRRVASRRVVDAVAHHHHHVARIAALPHELHLVLGKSAELVDVECAPRRGRRLTKMLEEHHSDAARLSCRNVFAGGGL